MPPIVLAGGLGCGLAIAAGTAMGSARSRRDAAARKSARWLTWLAAVLLLAAAAAAGATSGAMQGRGALHVGARLFLVAAITVPAPIRRYQCAPGTGWERGAPSVLLAGSGLAALHLVASPLRPEATGYPALLGLGVTVAAGLGIRAAAGVVAEPLASATTEEWSPSAEPVLTTAAVGLLFLVSLYRRGPIGLGDRASAGVAASFAGWSATSLIAQHRPIGRACLAATSGLWLLWVALYLL